MGMFNLTKFDKPDARMPDTLKIREATLEDAALIAEIYNESIRTGHATMDDALKTAHDIRQQIEAFTKREAYLLLEQDSYAVGWGLIKRYSPRGGYRFCSETSVYLRHSEIRKGYGSRIKRALIERCRTYGYHHLLARIFADNIAAIEYNRQLGYEVVGLQKEMGYKNGQWRDVVVMQRVLHEVPPEIRQSC